jgi:hypothetical protein
MRDNREVDDEARLAETIMEPDEPAAELLALHIVRDDGPRQRMDPESALVVEDLDAAPEYHFDDEEFEGRPPLRLVDDHEPDLEELLEQQHYAFPGEHGAPADGDD